MKEPETITELEDALARLGYAIVYRNEDNDDIDVLNMGSGARTKLLSKDHANALFEAWHLVKPPDKGEVKVTFAQPQ